MLLVFFFRYSFHFRFFSLSNVTLDTGIFLSGTTNNLAIGTEKCLCPEAYNGTSCQNPADGFYRSRNSSEWQIDSVSHEYERFVGRSMKCDCNGRSSRCDKNTGHCLDCEENTNGAKCENCADGFYGDPTTGCEACPCPETQKNFAKGCTFLRNRVSCLCKPGYEGDLCERCAVGYFGFPGSDDGHCTKCDCHEDGSISTECDRITGQCACKNGVIGRKCDRCDNKKSILQNGQCRGEYSA